MREPIKLSYEVLHKLSYQIVSTNWFMKLKFALQNTKLYCPEEEHALFTET